MVTLVTGGAGFIGSYLCSRLLDNGKTVYAFDNLCNSSLKNINGLLKHEKFKFIKCDVSCQNSFLGEVKKISKNCKIIDMWHLAANSDISAGIEDSEVDLKNTFLSTYSILRAAKLFDIRNLYFSSSSAIYGDHGGLKVSEKTGPFLPISNYGAMKLASEAIISSATHSYLDKSILFRFPNVIGTPATHGVILDFIKRLNKYPGTLQVLGDGRQRKPYLHVEDLLDAMLFLASKPIAGCQIFNIGPDDDGILVSKIAELVVENMGCNAEIIYQKSSKGWVGDVPKFSYSIDKLKASGWYPPHSSIEAVNKAIVEILRSFP